LLLHLPFHAMGVSITAKPGLPVVVFDPTKPAQQEFATLADFVASPYGRCTQVYEVGPQRTLDSFTSFFGSGLPHVRPEDTRGVRVN
jgi:hypothetical protein